WPAAAMMAETNMCSVNVDYTGVGALRTRWMRELPSIDGVGNDRMNAISERLRILDRRRLERRRLDRVVHDERDVGRLGAQPAFRHHGARADDGERHD